MASVFFKWFSDQGIRGKLLMFITIPIFTILLFAFYGISDQFQRYTNSKNTQHFFSLMITLDDLVHELQKERGISAGLIKTGEEFQEAIFLQREKTDQASTRFLQQQEKLELNFLKQETHELLFKINQLLAQLPSIRATIDNADLQHVVDDYSNLNAHIINFIQNIRLLVEEKELARLSHAYVNLLWLQERAGQERAVVIRILTTNTIHANYFRQVLGFIEFQESLINEYGIKAPLKYREMLQQILTGSVNNKVKNFRDVVANTAIRNEFLNELHALIGYGGVIYDFKNYIIHSDSSYLQSFLQKKSAVNDLINRYKQSNDLTQEDLSHIKKIENVLNQYFNLVNDVTKYIRQGLSAQEIGKLLEINDKAAFMAMENLRASSIGMDTSIHWWEYATERISLIKGVNDQLRSDMKRLVDDYTQSTLNFFWFFILITSLTLVISFIFCHLLMKRLVGSIKKISNDMERMFVENKFDNPLMITGKDEIGVMAGTFNKLLNERLKFKTQIELSAEVFANTNEAIMIADKHKQIQIVNTAFEEITGSNKNEFLGQDFFILNEAFPDNVSSQFIWDALESNGHWEGELWAKKANGKKYLMGLRINVVKNEDKIAHYIGIFADITERKQHEEHVWRQANFDSLTNLPNRNMCMDQLSQYLKRADRLKTQIAVLFIDLDRFKLINDSMGHDAGDELLMEIAKRLKKTVRESDIVCRLGGDEFVILLEGIQEAYILEKISENILAKIAHPVQMNDQTEAYISGSIGIALYPQDGQTVETLIKHADIAMYQSKKNGRNNFIFYQQEMNKAASLHMEIEKELRRAINEQQFCLHYQPVIDLSSGRIIGAEALIRWRHPAMGLVGPDKFIRIAEETDLIVPIGEWIITTAMKQAVEWNKLSDQPLKVAVNISSRQCNDHGRNIEEFLSKSLEAVKLEPGMLEIEITESLLMHGSDEMISSLQKIRDLGIGISLDDFGTGYSSLSYLKHFPISTIKIDQSFVKDVTTNEKDARLVQAIVMLGNALNLNVIGEGIELAEHADYLKKLSCRSGQGYYFSKPLTVEEFGMYLHQNATANGLNSHHSHSPASRVQS